jgi:DNA-binding XRE family transcriptional regulator
MIRTDAEYRDALKRLQQDRTVIAAQREQLSAMDLSADEVARALEPAQAFHEQLREEVDVYERLKRGEIAPIESLMDIGRVLVGLRIARGLTQRQLAQLMDVSETQVSRDERNDYHGITLERAQRIVQALHGRVLVQAEAPVENDGLVPA